MNIALILLLWCTIFDVAKFYISCTWHVRIKVLFAQKSQDAFKVHYKYMVIILQANCIMPIVRGFLALIFRMINDKMYENTIIRQTPYSVCCKLCFKYRKYMQQIDILGHDILAYNKLLYGQCHTQDISSFVNYI